MTDQQDSAQPEPVALLPCPFCGHDDPYLERVGTARQSCIVECGMCGARHESSDEGERSGSSWNERATITTAQAQSEPAPLTDERIDHIADLVVKGMPEGISGFCKSWGWRQFARAILADCAGHVVEREEPPIQRFAIVMDRHYEGSGLSLAVWTGPNYEFADGDCFDREGDTLDGYTAEFLTHAQLEQRLSVRSLT